jgi:hypothetical protein
MKVPKTVQAVKAVDSIPYFPSKPISSRNVGRVRKFKSMATLRVIDDKVNAMLTGFSIKTSTSYPMVIRVSGSTSTSTPLKLFRFMGVLSSI